MRRIWKYRSAIFKIVAGAITVSYAAGGAAMAFINRVDSHEVSITELQKAKLQTLQRLETIEKSQIRMSGNQEIMMRFIGVQPLAPIPGEAHE